MEPTQSGSERLRVVGHPLLSSTNSNRAAPRISFSRGSFSNTSSSWDSRRGRHASGSAPMVTDGDAGNGAAATGRGDHGRRRRRQPRAAPHRPGPTSPSTACAIRTARRPRSGAAPPWPRSPATPPPGWRSDAHTRSYRVEYLPDVGGSEPSPKHDPSTATSLTAASITASRTCLTTWYRSTAATSGRTFEPHGRSSESRAAPRPRRHPRNRRPRPS